MSEKVVTSILDADCDELINDLAAMVKIASVSDNASEVKKALLYVIDKAKSFGLSAKTVLDDSVGVIEYGAGEETVGILAHVDVVPADLADGWDFEPFAGIVTDKEVLGRGTMDDKGPLLAVLYAVRAIKESGIRLNKKIQIIIGTQEEVEWTDIEEYKKHYPLPTCGFSPDESFPINNKEKGYADMKAVFKAANIADGENEADGFQLIGMQGGTAVNSVPDKALLLCRGDYDYVSRLAGEGIAQQIAVKEENGQIIIEATGFATHSCYPEKGINAILHLAEFAGQLKFNQPMVNNCLRFINEKLSSGVHGKKLGLMRAAEYIDGEYFGQTYVVPTMLELKENSVELNVNLRIPFGLERKVIEERLAACANEYTYDFSLGEYIEPIYVPAHKPFVKLMAEAYESVTSSKADLKCAPALSYASAMPNIVSFGPLFPGEEDCCHEANEKVSKASLLLSAHVYAAAIMRMATYEGKLV